MMITILLFTAFSLLAATNSKNAFERSYPRDNTFCSHKEQRVELLIRTSSKCLEQKEKGYGELIFYKLNNKLPRLLPLSDFKSDTFRLFLGTSPICSKSHGHRIDDHSAAILFLKENRPFKDMLFIQKFDLATMTPKESVATNFPVDRVEKSKDGFSFRTFTENYNLELGKVTIDGETFIYHEKEFPLWMNYSIRGFETMSELTFEKFPWKEYFKDIKDFYLGTGWDASNKTFSKQIIYEAVNHPLKKRCILLVENELKLEGKEDWKCQRM